MFTFTDEKFSGPLDILLQMIEGEKVRIVDMSLADITDNYIQYIQTSETIDESEMADFLVVAAKLLYLKSKELLPQLVIDEESGVDLERQLKMYEQFARMAEEVKQMLLARRFMYPREPITIRATGFQPPKTLSAFKLGAAMSDIVTRFKPVKLDEVQVQKVMSIKEKIDSVQDMLKTFRKGAFKDFIADAKSRADVIVTFLALLELVKTRDIKLDQREHFDHIYIEATQPTL
ncbi:MAG: ScpA family protein [Candidatus Magasanikbacteria bacterium]|nr:ScpA family protein [Candidatus Magasanikbacteria bacterium]